MKSEFNNANILKFPCLAESTKGDKFIVLFTDHKKGTVVYDPENIHGLGFCHNAWVEVEYVCWRILEPGEHILLTQ
jgi:hypothetical protein